MSKSEKRTLVTESEMAGRKIESNIDLINADVEKAMQAEAWMLAFAGICIALDILAKDHYFKLVFMDQHPQQDGEDIKVWAEQRLFPEWDKYKKSNGSLKTIYLWALEKWGVSDPGLREDIYTFRNGMLHSFEPNPFSITHEASPNKHIVNNSGKGRRILHLPDYFAFEKKVQAKVALREGYIFDTFRLMETTTE
jgi:hypothetical protein